MFTTISDIENCDHSRELLSCEPQISFEALESSRPV